MSRRIECPPALPLLLLKSQLSLGRSALFELWYLSVFYCGLRVLRVQSLAFVPRAGRRSTVVGRVPLVLEIACRRGGRAGADPGHLPGEPGSSVQGGGGAVHVRPRPAANNKGGPGRGAAARLRPQPPSRHATGGAAPPPTAQGSCTPIACHTQGAPKTLRYLRLYLQTILYRFLSVFVPLSTSTSRPIKQSSLDVPIYRLTKRT